MATYDACLLWIFTLLSLSTTNRARSITDSNCYCDTHQVVATTTATSIVNPAPDWLGHKSCHTWTEDDLLKSLAQTLQHSNKYILDALIADLRTVNVDSIILPIYLYKCLPKNTINLNMETTKFKRNETGKPIIESRQNLSLSIYKAVFLDLWKMSVLVNKLRSKSAPTATLDPDEGEVPSTTFNRSHFQVIDNHLRNAYCRYQHLVEQDFVWANILEPPIDWSECRWTCRDDRTCLARELLVLSHLQFVAKSTLDLLMRFHANLI